VIPVRLELDGFLSYRTKTVVDFDGITAAAIVGDNGAGKTSLIEAMSWALFGQGRGTGPDSYVSVGATLARVVFDFELAGLTYRVERQRDLRGGGKSYLGLFHYQDDDSPTPIGGDHIRDVQATIESLVGLTFDQWTATSYIAQGRADAFTRLTPAGRKELLAQILDLARFTDAAEAAKVAAGRLEGERTILASRIPHLEQTADQEDRARVLAGEAAGRREQHREDAERFRAAIDEARTMLALAESRERERERLTAEAQRVAQSLIDAHAAAAGANEDAKRAAELRASVDPMRATAEQTQAEAFRQDTQKIGHNGTIEANIATSAEVRERLLALGRDDARCFTCGTPLNPAALAGLRDGLREKLSGLEAERGRLIEVRDAAAAKAAALFTDAQTLQAKAERLSLQAADLESQARLKRVQRDLIPDLETRQRELMAALEDLPAPDPDALEAVRELLPVAEAEAKDAQAAAEQAAMDVGEWTQALAQAREAASERDVTRAQIADLEADGQRFRLCAEAFGPAGVPALIIEAALPAIESEANAILARLAPRYTVAFASLRALKTGGVRETLDVLVADDVADRPLESLSGGERQAVDLAIRIGLARLIAGRADRRIQTLILDEAFTALDSARRQATIGLIHALTSEFDQVWFVTHDRDMADAFPTKVLVSAADGTSSVTMERGTG
jgi:DNA repair exonuclease SbcCD ATPase subunit